FSRDWSSDVCSSDLATMRLGDLAREHEPDPGAIWLGGEERDEQIARVGKARSPIAHPDLQPAVLRRPTHLGFGCAVQGRIDRVRSEERRVGKECTYR